MRLMNMGLNELVHWYQKKIGTYDKQQWERTIEQYILDGLTHIPMRTAKLKTELIDVDLVRGSSFPKAKPKHGLSTVACLAFQRLLFLPLYKKWWIQQTSYRIFLFFLLLYSLQAINLSLYYIYVNRENEAEIVSMSEVLVPVVMMFVLCIVHSHIVSTHSGPTMLSNQSRQRITRRSRHVRCRNGKSRHRQNLRIHKDSKSSQDIASEKASTGSEEVLTAVRFAKKVVIENSSIINQVQESASAQIVFDKEAISTTGENSNPPNESSANIEQPENIPEERVANIHQDDDGFESLNGNVSSDNDRVIGQGNRSRQGVMRQNKNLTLWSEDNTSQQVSLPPKHSAPDPLKNDDKFTDSKSNIHNNSEEKNADPKILGSREARQQCESEEEGECEEATTHHLTEATTSATEWMGVTTNSDDCSYSSELGESDLASETNLNYGEFVEHPFSWEFELPPSILLNSTCTSSDRVSCTIWTRRDIKKAELSVLDISSAIIARVESMPESMNYFYGGLILSIALCLIPSIKRLSDHMGSDNISNVSVSLLPSDMIQVNLETYTDVLCRIIGIAFGSTFWERILIIISTFERLMLSCFLFFLLAVAERTYKQRLLYAKLFSHLTSSRRAQKSDLPHFRLNKVRNIKTWLSVRSYLKRRGPQRSVDVIVSAVFIVTILLLSFVSLELIKDLESLHSRYNVEALFWSFSLGIFILRFMTLGTKINKKYRNLSVLITEQINLYLQIEQKPHKKEELMVANSVLKLAADLIKVNFVLTQFTALILAGLFRSSLSPIAATPAARHVYGLIIGLALGYFCFGRQAIHLASLPALCYVAMRTQNPRNMQRVVLAIALIYLSCIHFQRQIYDYGSYTLDITGPLMVITQKVTSLAYSIHDGLTRREEELTPMQRHQAVQKIPTTLEYFSYIFHFQALMAGPIIFYRDYMDFIYGHHLPGSKSLTIFYDKNSREKEIVLEPSPTLVVVKKVVASLACAIVFITFISDFPIQRVKEDEFLKNTSMLYKMWYLMLTTMLSRFKYYHAWLFADAICNNSGLGFSGYDERGRPKWDLTSNVDVYKFETSLNLRDSIESWNKGTNLWLRSIMYERAGRNKVLYTYALSAFWHGFYPGYYLTFASGAFFTVAARSVRRHIRPLFLESQRKKTFYDILTFITTRIVMAYMTFSFILLEFMPSIKVYLYLYMLPHLLGLIAIILPPRLGLSKKAHKQSAEIDLCETISNGNAHKTM